MIKNLIAGVLCCLCFCALVQCSKEEKAEQNSKEQLDSIAMQTMDTIKVKYDGEVLLLTDVRKDKLAYFDFFSKEILVTNRKGEIISKFNHSLLGSESFGNFIYGVHFQNDSVLSILSNKGYFMYGLNGALISKYLHTFNLDFSVYMNGDFKLSYDKKRNQFVSLLTTATDLGSNKPEFFEQARHITTFNLDSMKYSWHVPYEAEGSYLQKKYYTGEWNAHYDINDDTIGVVVGRDPIVYLYRLSDFKKLSSFSTVPEYFKQEVKFEFGSDTFSDHKKRLTSYANSDYRRIFLRGDTVFTSYSGGIPLNVFESINNLEDYNTIGVKNQKHYVQLFVNTKKTSKDLELPKEFPLLMQVSNGTLYLGEQERWLNKHDGYKRFLVCKLNSIPPEASTAISLTTPVTK